MKKYKTILADCPWDFPSPHRSDLREGSWFWNGDVMTIEQLSLGKIPSAENSVLFLWTPNSVLFEALKVMNAWGFHYFNNMVWVKIDSKGYASMGMGSFLRNSHEVLLIGMKGKVKANSHNIKSAFFTQRLGGRAQKPDLVYDFIEKLCDPPYLELFARQKRKNWASYGRLEDGSDIKIEGWDK